MEAAGGGGKKRLKRAWFNYVRGKGAAPAELEWVVVMDRVGGYRALVELEMDGPRYRDMRQIVLPEEAAAAKVTQQEREAAQRRAKRGRG